MHELKKKTRTNETVVSRRHFISTLRANSAVGCWTARRAMSFAIGPHDHRTAGSPKLTSMATGLGAVVGVFGSVRKMLASDNTGIFVWELRVVMKGTNNPTTGTLEYGEHELGDFKASTETQVVTFSVNIDRDRCWDSTRGSTFYEPWEPVSFQEMG